MRRVRLLVVSVVIGAGSLLPQLGTPAKASTCQINAPAGDAVCDVVNSVTRLVCSTVNKPCIM
jgi:hypothetical protein